MLFPSHDTTPQDFRIFIEQTLSNIQNNLSKLDADIAQQQLNKLNQIIQNIISNITNVLENDEKECWNVCTEINNCEEEIKFDEFGHAHYLGTCQQNHVHLPLASFERN